MKLAEHPLDGMLFGGDAGFFGPNRDALGFKSVAELGAGVEVPLATGANASSRVRLGASYLFGPRVEGWSVTLGLRN